MTHRLVFAHDLPTLALLALGASEALIGLQRSLLYLGVLAQLPTLHLVARVPKRSLLLAGQLVALAGSIPLVGFGVLEAQRGALRLGVAVAGLAIASAGIGIGDTVWFPLLHGYQEPGRIGRFFAWLRTGWHLALIAFFLGAQRWLAAHPGRFGPLFAVGFAAGVLRLVLVARLPERSERSGASIRVREAFGLALSHPRLRRYLIGIGLGGAARTTAVAFALVMLRREIGFAEGDVLYTTVAIYVGGLAALWLAGRAVDALGPWPVFRWSGIGYAVLVLGFSGISRPDAASLALAVALFFGLSALAAAFDVADTHVLFGLAPEAEPARTLVAAQVVGNLVRAAAPLAAGAAIALALAAGAQPLSAYRVLFAACGALVVLATWSLRVFGAHTPSRLARS